MLRIALTGGIASGKSRVADCFAELGAPVVDTDRLAREVVEPGTPGLEAVVEAFGRDLLTSDARLDRAALRRTVFADPAARERLEAILHPRIRERLAAELAVHAEAGAPYALAVIPLLVETGQASDFDRVLVVDTPVEVQVERVVARDGGTPDDARAIIAQQVDRDRRLTHADDIVRNAEDGPAEQTLMPQVRALDRKYRHLAAAAGNPVCH